MFRSLRILHITPADVRFGRTGLEVVFPECYRVPEVSQPVDAEQASDCQESPSRRRIRPGSGKDELNDLEPLET